MSVCSAVCCQRPECAKRSRGAASGEELQTRLPPRVLVEKGGASAVPTVRTRAAGGVRVRSGPAWRLALTNESKADMAKNIYFCR